MIWWQEFAQAAKTAKPGRKCQLCRQRPAVHAMQYMDGPNKPPTFVRPGYHYRGWKVTKVCDECKQSIERGETPQKGENDE